MLRFEQYQAARQRALFHGQVRILTVATEVRTPGQASVEAGIVKIFRGPPPFLPGAEVRFDVSVLSGDEPLEQIPLGGTIWTNLTALRAASYLEVFLNGNPPECEIALWQQRIIDQPSDRPQTPAAHL